MNGAALPQVIELVAPTSRRKRRTPDRPRPIAAVPLALPDGGSDRMLTPNEAAGILRLADVDAVRALAARGDVPALNVGTPNHPRYLISERALYAWLESRRVEAPPERAKARSVPRSRGRVAASFRARKRGLSAHDAPRSL